MDKGNEYKNRLIQWREGHNISEKHLIVVLSLLVGIATAISGWLLKTMIHGCQYFVENILIHGQYTWWY